MKRGARHTPCVPGPALWEEATVVAVDTAPKSGKDAKGSSTERTSESWPARALTWLFNPGRGDVRYMYHHLVLPWYWCATTVVATVVTVALAQEGHEAGTARALVTSLVLVAAWVGVWAVPARIARTTTTRLRFERHWITEHPGHTRLIGAAMATWASTLVLVWPTRAAGLGGWWVLIALAPLLTLVVSARYWQWHRHHTEIFNAEAILRLDGVDVGMITPGRTGVLTALQGAQETPMEAPQPPEQTEDWIGALRADWAHLVQAPGGVLPGAGLKVELIQSGVAQGHIDLVRPKQTLSTVRQNMEALESALGVPAELIDITKIPATPHRLKVRITSEEAEPPEFSLKDHANLVLQRGENTYLTFGGLVDGSGMAHWLLYDDSGIMHGSICGTSGGGKSVLGDTLVIGALETGNTAVLYVDPKGNSSPRLAKHAHVSLVTESYRKFARFLTGVEAAMSARQALVRSGRSNSSKFRPSQELPGLLIVIDEAHRLTKDPDLAKRLDDAARMGRSLGVGLLLMSQGYTLPDWGGRAALRDNVSTMNAVSLKLGRDNGASFQSAFGVDANPASLPDPKTIRTRPDGTEYMPFAGMALHPRINGRLRTMYGSEAYREERMRLGRQNGLQALDPATWGAIDEASEGLLSRADEEQAQAQAAAEADLRRWEDLAKRAQAGQRRLPRPTSEPARPATSPGGGGVVVDLDALREMRTEPQDPTPARAPAPVPTEPTPTDTHSHRMSAAQIGIREVLAQAPTNTGGIIAALRGRPGCGSTTVREELKKMEADGVIEHVRPSQKSPWRLKK